MKDWSKYQNNVYNNKVCNLLIDFLENHKVKNVVDLGCGSCNEAVYLIKKGVNVICIDRQINKDFVFNRINDFEKDNVKFIESSFEDVTIPKAELITAFYSIPFCLPDKFEELWNKIYDAIEDNGYFVGQLFGDRDDWNKNKFINTFSIEKVTELLKRYEIEKLEEVEYTRKFDNKKWHYYNIIAKK